MNASIENDSPDHVVRSENRVSAGNILSQLSIKIYPVASHRTQMRKYRHICITAPTEKPSSYFADRQG